MACQLMTYEKFQCSICLDVFDNPVTISCGHNFCQTCINKYWDSTAVCQCPLCKRTFIRRPQVSINTTMKDLVDEFKKIRDPNSDVAQSGEVACDMCSGDGQGRLRALKTCLDCGTSFCTHHLEFHQRVPRYQSHTLMEPLQNIEERMCQKHQRPLELFCRDDHMCVCRFCSEGEHKNHNIALMEEEGKERKSQMEKNREELQQKIKDKQENIADIQHKMEIRRSFRQQEDTYFDELFSVLGGILERCRLDIQGVQDSKQCSVETDAEDAIRQLQQDINTLQERDKQLEELIHTPDHFHLLQADLILHQAPSITESDMRIDDSPVHIEIYLLELEKSIQKEIIKFLEDNLGWMQCFAVDVILDPDTAHPLLQLSVDQKQVNCGDHLQNVPDLPARFDTAKCVLGKQGFSGKFYFQVKVAEKSSWSIGVARETLMRKGEVKAAPSNGCWTIVLKGRDRFLAGAISPQPLFVEDIPQTVGVFVDYDKGRVSFYDVENKSQIFSFTGQSFSGKLFPILSPGANEAGENLKPLVITPVNKQA